MNWKWIIAAAAVGSLAACDTDQPAPRGPAYVPPPTASVNAETELEMTDDDQIGALETQGIGEAGAGPEPNPVTVPATDDPGTAPVVTVSSTASFDDVVDKLEEVAGRYEGYELSEGMDAEDVADEADIELGKTKVFTLENPTLTAPMMRLSPSIALELPIRILVYEQGGETHLAYHDPKHFAVSHGVSSMDGSVTALSIATRNIVGEVVGDTAVLGDMRQRDTVPRIAPSGEVDSDEVGIEPGAEDPIKDPSAEVTDY